MVLVYIWQVPTTRQDHSTNTAQTPSPWWCWSHQPLRRCGFDCDKERKRRRWQKGTLDTSAQWKVEESWLRCSACGVCGCARGCAGLRRSCSCDTCIHKLFAPGRSILENRGVIPASELTNNHTSLHTWACCGGWRLRSSRLRGDKDGKRFAGGELVAGYLFIGETSFWYCDYSCLRYLCLLQKWSKSSHGV